MGAANCCKKPTEIVIIEEIKNNDEEKINPLEHDSIPQDTEFVHRDRDDNYQQEVSNQNLYEQEYSPQIGGAYEVQIKESTPEQNNNQINEDYANYNIQQDEIQYQNPEDQNNNYKEELVQYNLINENPNINQSPNQPGDMNQFEIQQSNTSNTGPIDLAQISSQRNEAPVEQIQKDIIPQNINQIKQTEEEDLNKYFQLPPGQYNNVLEKSKTSIPNDLDMEQIQKLIQQHESQSQQPFNNANIKEEKNENENQPELKLTEVNDIINMKNLPNTSASNNINQMQDTTPTTFTDEQIQNLINAQNLPQSSFDSNAIMNQNHSTGTTTTIVNNYNQPNTTTTTTTTKTMVENTPIDLKQFGLENISIPNKQKTMANEPIEEDYSKYFQQQGTTTQQISNSIDLNNLGISNNTQGPTIQNPVQNINNPISKNNVNYVVNQPILTKMNSTPITMQQNLNNYLNANKTTTVINPTNAAISSINPQINYGLNNTQQKTIVTTTKTTGIPTQTYFSQSYTLPSNYAQTKTTTTTQVIKSGGPTQVLQYSNTIPNNIPKYN